MKSQNILKRIFKISLPSFIGFVFYNSFLLIDMYWVARLGSEHVAAVAVFASIFWVFNSFNSLGGSSSLPLISKNFGKGDLTKTGDNICDSIRIKLLSGIFSTILGLSIIYFLLNLITDKQGIVDLALKYGIPRIFSFPFLFTKFTIYTSMRSINRADLTMKFSIVESLLNIVLDPILIFGWGPFPALGIAAPGIIIGFTATMMSLVGIISFIRGIDGVRIDILKRPFIGSEMKVYLRKVGVPAVINSVLKRLSFPVIMKVITSFSPEIIALYGIIRRVSRSLLGMTSGFGLGMSSLIGIMTGEGDKEQLRETSRTFLRILTLFYLPVLTIASILSDKIIYFYLQKEVALFEFPARLVFIIFLAILFGDIINLGYMYIFNGSGNTKLNLYSNFTAIWVFQIPLLFFFRFFLNMDIVLISSVILTSRVLMISILHYFFKVEFWLDTKIHTTD